MAELYHDPTRIRIFNERAKRYGPLSGPERCSLSVLEWSPGTNPIPRMVETTAEALCSRVQPRVQIVFAPLDIPVHETGAGIELLFEKYGIPSDFISQRLQSVSHSFSAVYDGADCSSWFHFLCKSITYDNDSLHQAPGIADPRGTELSQGDWTWIRTSVFLRWRNCFDVDKAAVTLIIFSASPELRDRCQGLWSGDLADVLADPFSLFVICLDELWLQAQGRVQIVSAVFGKMERNALDLAHAAKSVDAASENDFVGLHNIAKHIIFLKEGSEATALMASHLLEFHQELLKQPPQGHDAMPATRLANQMLKQKVVQFEVWKMRMTSLEKRMQNIINLSFNLVTQHDSQVLRHDSKSMKAIASVTMVFLPLATIATVFGSQFFNFDPERRKISVATNFWIFWALFGPLSILVFLSYYYLCHIRQSEKGPSPQAMKLKRIMGLGV